MAERPVFLPSSDGSSLVSERYFTLHWHSGFAAIQKKRNIQELHASALNAGLAPLLEVSSKSDKTIGRHLSAFHLQVHSRFGSIPLESAFQGSKVFERGGPYKDLLLRDPIGAKRDPRLRLSGKLLQFEFEGRYFPLEPKTLFYDWLYTTAIYEHRIWLKNLYQYAGFTDIEFNPSRSISCQARSVALFISLLKRNLLDEAVRSPEALGSLLFRFDYRPGLRESRNTQDTMFS